MYVKSAIVAATVLLLSACASAPATREDRLAQAERSCAGETANVQGVAISPYAGSSNGWAFRECMSKKGFRGYTGAGGTAK